MARKKNVLSTTVRWSQFEIVLCRYLMTVGGRALNEELRTAVRFYVRHLPEFGPDQFLDFVGKFVAENMPKGPDRDQLMLEANAFSDLVRDTGGHGIDRVSTRDEKMLIRSSQSDFDFDDGVF